MLKHKIPVIIALLMAFTFALVAPATPAYAASLSDLVPKIDSSSGSSSGNGFINVLLGLLFGKLFNNMSSTDSSSEGSGKTLTPETKTTASGQALIATGQKYMGVPYVWGGETPEGFDCSGFTQYVMQQNGIQIPRTAAEQYAAGRAVDKANLQVGDLVFFTTYKPGASHVGFYMGGGKFLHASSAAKQVTINSLDEQYYTEHYIGARTYHR